MSAHRLLEDRSTQSSGDTSLDVICGAEVGMDSFAAGSAAMDGSQHTACVMQQVAWVYVTAAVLATVGFLYASTIPMVLAVPHYGDRILGAFVPSPWDAAQLFDIAANVLAFIPLGFLWAAAWSTALPDGRSKSETFVRVALGAFGLALFAEALQVWIPLRDPSIRDVLALEWGAVLGYRLWQVVGTWTTGFLRRWVERLYLLGGPRIFRLRWPVLSTAVFGLCMIVNCYASPTQLFLLYRFRSTSLEDVAFALHNAAVRRSPSLESVLFPSALAALSIVVVCRIAHGTFQRSSRRSETPC